MGCSVRKVGTFLKGYRGRAKKKPSVARYTKTIIRLLHVSCKAVRKI